LGKLKPIPEKIVQIIRIASKKDRNWYVQKQATEILKKLKKKEPKTE